MKYATLFFLICCLQSAFTTTYYLDYENGDDANDGLTAATPWKNLQKIQSTNAPGDVFLFKRGVVWDSLQLYLSVSGTSTQPIRFGAYGTGDDPILSNIDTLPNSDDPTAWTEETPDIWRLALNNPPGRLFIDQTEYLRADTSKVIGEVDDLGIISYWYHDDGALYLYASQNPATLPGAITGSRLAYAVIIDRADHLIFNDIEFRGGFVAALGILGARNVEVSNCQLGHSGSGGAFVSEFRDDMAGIRRAARNITFTSNIFNSNFQQQYGPASGRGVDDGIRLRRAASNCLVDNNVFTNWAHNAVELLGDDATAEGVNDNVISNNRISAPDIPYAHPLGADGVLGKCQFNEFFNNRAEHCRTACQINGNDNWVHHNVMRNMRRSPAKDDVTAYAFILSVYDVGLVCQNNRYDHNLIYDTDEGGFLIRGYGFSNQVKDNLIRNNVVVNTGVAPYNAAYETGTAIVIYDIGNGVGPNTYQNNLFYSDDPDAGAVYLQDFGLYLSAADFNARDGIDGNTISNNLDSDPRYTNLDGGNYLPADNSPLINAALDVGLDFDLDGNDRVFGAAPDIGPLETNVLVPLPVEWGDFTVQLTPQRHARLDWNLRSAVNLKIFQIERSPDGRTWSAIGTTSPNASHRYHFLDQTLRTSAYYRIQQVDWDGRFSYSPVRYLHLPQAAAFRLHRLGPHQCEIRNDDLIDWSTVSAILVNAAGQSVLRLHGRPDFQTTALPAGLYWLRVLHQGRILIFNVPVE